MSIFTIALITVAVTFVLPVIIVVILVKRSRREQRASETVAKQEPGKTPATAPATTVASPQKTDNTGAKTFWVAMGLLAILSTFQIHIWDGGVPYLPYTIPESGFYIPLAGLLYYGLAWMSFACLASSFDKSANILVGLLVLSVAVYALIGGFAMNWYLPFENEHVVQNMLGSVTFPSDIFVPINIGWDLLIPIVILLIIANLIRSAFEKRGVNATLFLMPLAVCLFGPQLLLQIFS